MTKKKSKRKTPKRRKRIDSYKKTGKKLQPPLASYTNLQPVDYQRHWLPQLLWLESLLDCHGEEKFPGFAHRFLDLIDNAGTNGSQPVSGLVESFSYVPKDVRNSFVANNRRAVEIAVIEPFGDALRLYSDSPMHWLLTCYGDSEGSRDPESTLARLKTWTMTLLDRCGDHSNIARAIVLSRYLKAGKIKLPPDAKLIDELVQYPRCQNRKQTEADLRALSNIVIGTSIQSFEWSNTFWETNGRISMCTVCDDQSVIRKSLADPITDITDRYIKTAGKFLPALQADFHKCIPDPSSFETSVLPGLLARASMLGLDMLTSQSLWVGEIGGILLRCLCETLILLAWLIKKEDKELYHKYVQYSFGQQDLYGLKLNDYDGYRQAFQSFYLGPKKLADKISEDSWEAQLRTINLGNWANIDTRKMADQGGTKMFYDLIFSLSSADVHSQFISLAKWNLVFCTNPLHNNHMIPAFGRRSVNPYLPLTAAVLVQEVCKRFFEHYKIAPECTKVLSCLLKEMSEEIQATENPGQKA